MIKVSYAPILICFLVILSHIQDENVCRKLKNFQTSGLYLSNSQNKAFIFVYSSNWM